MNIKFKKIIIALLSLLLILIVGCNNKNNQQDDASMQIVKNYFKYMNEKNKKELLSILTDKNKGSKASFGLEDLEYIKLINIKEEKELQKENFRVYTVDYEVKYSKDSKYPQKSGRYKYQFSVVRKDKNSPWLIDDMGEG